MKQVLTGLLLFGLSFNIQADNGLIQLKSPYSIQQTTDKLISILKGKGMTIFAQINHSSGAKKVNIELAPTQVIIFGNPKIGSLLMQCQRTIAIDLPQKALIWRDANAQVWVTYNDAEYLAKRHHMNNCHGVVEKVKKALNKLITTAIK